MKTLGKIFALLVVFLGSVWALPSWMHAQSVNQAALVVRYDENQTESVCVQFEESQISGLDLLQRSGLDFTVDVQGLGAAVCSIENTGCPANDCWCQCSGGGDCIYWSFWNQIEGGWQYSQAGATNYQVDPGAVQGWSWGPGAVNAAIPPPDLTFEEVCQLAPADTQTPTPSPMPSSTPTSLIVSVPDTATPAMTKPTTASTVQKTATATVQSQSSPTPNATTNNPISNTPRPQSTAETLISTATPTQPVQPTQLSEQLTQLPTLQPIETSQEDLSDQVAVVTEKEILTNEEATAVPATATMELETAAVLQNPASTDEPRALAEAPTISPVGIINSREPVAVIGAGVVPTFAPIQAASSNDDKPLIGSPADRFAYLIFLVIAGGFVGLLILNFYRRRDQAQ